MLDTPRGLVLCNSCCHAGADTVVREVQAAFPGRPIRAIVGGFHLSATPDQEVRALARRLRDTGVERVLTGHCTGERGFALLREELGDVLLHVAFYAKIGSETGDFDMKDVCDRLCEKLIFRHPHVFGDVKAETAGQVSENWEQLKLKEKDGNKTVLSGVPAALPSLIKAYRIQDKARNVGFDWEEREQVWDKVKEEIQEFQDEVAHMDKQKAEEEFGDVMFSLINAARLYKINPDNALEHTNQKFIRRFNYVEAHSIKEGKNLHDMTLEEMDKLWEEAKALENKK